MKRTDLAFVVVFAGAPPGAAGRQSTALRHLRKGIADSIAWLSGRLQHGTTSHRRAYVEV